MQPGMYFATNAERLLTDAQRVLDVHVTSSGGGRCLGCGAPGPCGHREWAVAVFSRSMRLPRREPGATHPEKICRSDSGNFWFRQNC